MTTDQLWFDERRLVIIIPDIFFIDTFLRKFFVYTVIT